MASKRKKPSEEQDSREGAAANSVLPMQLHVGDCFTDETGEWEIIIRP